MPKQYVIKNPPIDQNRLNKICKDVIDNAKENRAACKTAYLFFKDLLDANPNDFDARKNMLDALKLVQSAELNKSKILEVLIKAEIAFSNGDGRSSSNSTPTWKDLTK